MEVHFSEKPRLKNPTMVAAWPGMGMLAKMSADYLVQHLDAKQFAEICSPRNDTYFKEGVGELGVDRHFFHYWRGKQGHLIVCSGEVQPQSLEALYQLANRVLDVAEEFNVKRIYTFAAFPHPHEVEPQVFAVVNQPGLKEFLKEKGVTLVGGEGTVVGLNGLLISVALQRGIEGICLLCDIQYLDVPQPRSAQALLKTLTALLGIEVDLSDLERQAEEVEEKIKRIKEQRAPEVVKSKEPKYIS